MSRLAALELGVTRQDRQPWRGAAAEAERVPSIAEQQPGSPLIEPEHVGQAVRPATRERRRQARFERLDRRAHLEPGDATGDRHPPHCPPRPLLMELHSAYWLDVRANPRLGLFLVPHGTNNALTARLPDTDAPLRCWSTLKNQARALGKACSCTARAISHDGPRLEYGASSESES